MVLPGFDTKTADAAVRPTDVPVDTLSVLSDEELLAATRASPADACWTMCGSWCCRNGKLNLDDGEAERFLGATLSRRETERRMATEWDGSRSLALHGGCPLLDAAGRCVAYEGRPRGCRDYPLFRYGSLLVIAQNCPAKERLMPFLGELERRGFRVR